MDVFRVQAKFIVASVGNILHPGELVIRHGRVVSVAKPSAGRPDVDLGDVVLIPGLINAHTHLEFSDCKQPFAPGPNFPAWVSAVVRHRSMQQTLPDFETHRVQALLSGARECFDTGTVLLGDIVTQPWCAEDLSLITSAFQPDQSHPLFEKWTAHISPLAFPRILPFAEIIGLNTERLDSMAKWAKSTEARCATGAADNLWGFGVSPHAPYSLLHPEAVDYLREFDPEIPFAMHIAESLDERQWVETGQGAFRAAFEKLGISIPPERMQFSDAIALLASRQRSLLIHGNYLTQQEMDSVANDRQTSVVYCPRTHRHFGHNRYPLEELTKRKIRVVFGTDSRASNPDLNLWSEMQAARLDHPALAPDTAFSAITSEAALALGGGDDFGSLQPGKLAYANTLTCARDLTVENLLETITTEACSPKPFVHAILQSGR